VTSDLWWKNAVFYCLDVETFLDADGDGCGDLPGLCERVDYLRGIGIDCVWLMPFMPSCQRDDGYDITDFYGVDARLGTHGDLVDVVRTARESGIRVIADLVVNHTSNEHPWFTAARRSRDSPFHDFYVWRDEKPDEKPGDVVFPDQESSNWAFEEEVERWYMHSFYSHQPDLNVANPEVRDEIAQTVGFWLQQGLSGFRVDAVPFLIEPPGTDARTRADPHKLLRDLRSYIGRRAGDAVLMGEVNLPPPQLREFFGAENGDELQVVLSFTVNQAMYLALAREDATPLKRALEDRGYARAQVEADAPEGGGELPVVFRVRPGILTTVAFLPQVLRTWRTRSTADISLVMFLVYVTGIVLWLMSWVPFAAIVGADTAERAAIWTAQVVIGILGLALAGTAFATMVKTVGWRHAPAAAWRTLLHGQTAIVAAAPPEPPA